jgi:hypothetical protein
VGFVHGVMNTDNTTLSGETIDYGPCAFMEAFDPATVFSSIDEGGPVRLRQPAAGRRVEPRPAREALLPLLHDDEEQAISLAVDASAASAGSRPGVAGRHAPQARPVRQVGEDVLTAARGGPARPAAAEANVDHTVVLPPAGRGRPGTPSRARRVPRPAAATPGGALARLARTPTHGPRKPRLTSRATTCGGGAAPPPPPGDLAPVERLSRPSPGPSTSGPARGVRRARPRARRPLRDVLRT